MKRTDDPGVVSPSDDTGTKARQGLEPAHLIILLVALTALALTVGPVTEIDSYWHVLIGDEILRSGSFSGLGNAWSLYAPGADWATSQWLAEVTMSLTVKWLGWSGLMWWRTIGAVAVVVVLAATLLKRSSPRAAAFVMTVVLLPAVPALLERPMLISLAMLAWLSGAAFDVLTGRSAPRWWIVAGLVALWANFHGMWVLAPAAFGLVAVGLALDRDPSRRPQITMALRLTGIALIAGCLTPLGPRGLLLPFTFSSATANIVEWQRTTLWSSEAIGLVVLSGLLVTLWARSRHEVRWSQVTYWAGWTLFGLLAARNVVPASLMLAPLAAAGLSARPFFAPHPVAPQEQQALKIVGVIFTVIAAGWIIFQNATIDPLTQTRPLAIAKALADVPGEKRVFNGYNAAGVLAAFGGDGIRLAIDGRSDRFGSAYIARHADAMSLQGDWQELLTEVAPDYAVIATDNALTHELVTHQGWTEVTTDGLYSMLKAPSGDPVPNR